jgi:orotidine-5'-phosphate decarboxylase
VAGVVTPIPIIALDVPTAEAALATVDRLGSACRFYKVGSELFTAAGPGIVRSIIDRGADVFLDIKLHDIPNTVRGGVRSAAALGARLVTVHASGGRAMLAAAAEGAAGKVGVLAVTVLTSLDAGAVAESWGREQVDVAAEVDRLAGLAAETGVAGVVCSGHEAARVRRRHERLEIMVPGIRLAGGATHDQTRIVTPAEAAAAGATYVVVGRAVTAADDPVAAMAEVGAQLGTA